MTTKRKPRKTYVSIKLSIHVWAWQHQALSRTAYLNNLSLSDTIINILSGKHLKKPDISDCKKQYPEPLKTQIQITYDPSKFDLNDVVPEDAQISKTIREKLSVWL
jgi:hypothetical protein